MSLLILSPRSTPRRQGLQLAEELHFDSGAVQRAVAAIDRERSRAHTRSLLVRSDVHGLKVADVRRVLTGLPSPGASRVAITPLRYRTRPPLSGLCDFDAGPISVRAPEPFLPFD